VDFFHHVALLASISENGVEIPTGVGRYIISNNDISHSAEVAFAVDEAYQGLGIATLLLRHLTQLARAAGLRQFTALVLPDNQKMLHVFQHCGLPMRQTVNDVGVLEIVLELPQLDGFKIDVGGART
jgi:GNAT superfamily N-acetyltransferase